MKNIYFVKLVEHSPEFYALIKKRPTAFVLLAVIADRARKVPLDIDDGLEVGEAFIGDYAEYGATPQSYRTDKQHLERLKIATFKSTNKGTIAKIVNSSIFDISRISPTSKSTDQQQTDNMQLTTKQEERDQIKERGASLAIEKNSFFQDRPVSSSIATHSSPNRRSIHTPIDKEDYWNIHAPRIADEMGIEEDSWKFINAKSEWLKKATTPTFNSIKAFLELANDWEQ